MKFNRIIIATSIVLAASPAYAEKFGCACLSTAKSSIESFDDYTLSCNETFNAGSTDELTQNEHNLKLYLPGSEHTQSDKDVTYKFRPRNDACLLAVYDGENGKNSAEQLVDPQWGGAMCDNGNKKKIGGFNLKNMGENKGVTQWLSTFHVTTDKKSYDGLSLYLQTSGDKYLAAVCLQDK